MKKTLITVIAIIVSAFVFNIGSSRAFADSSLVYSFSMPPITVCEDVSNDAVKVGSDIEFYVDGVDYYMFLPSTADLSSVKVRYVGSRVLFDQLTGQTYEYGDVLTMPVSVGENSVYEYDEAEEKYYVYKFIALSAVNSMTMYVSLDNGMQDVLAINTDIDNSASGSLTIIDNGGSNRYNGKLDRIQGSKVSPYVPSGEIETKNSYDITLAAKTSVLSDASKSCEWSLIAPRQWIYDAWASPEDSLRPADSIYDQSGFSYLNAFYTYNALVKDEYSNIAGEFTDVYINGKYWGVYIVSAKPEQGGVFDVPDLDAKTQSLEGVDLPHWCIAADTDPDDEAIKAGIRQYFYDPARYTDEDTDISGGYVLTSGSNSDFYFVTRRGVEFSVISPKNPSKDEMIYISCYVQQFEDALSSPTGYNKLGKHYSEYADTTSFEAMMLVYSFYMNWKMFRQSTYISKDADTSEGPSKLVFGPAWDFEQRYYSGTGMFGESMIYTVENQYAWPEYFWQHGELMSGMYGMNGKMKDVLATLLGDKRTDMIYSLKEMTDNYAPSQQMNWIRWGMSESFQTVSNSVDYNIRTRYENWYGEVWNDYEQLEGIYVDGRDNKDGSYTFTAHIKGNYSGEPVWYKVQGNKTDLVQFSKGETSVTVRDEGIYICAVEGNNNAYASYATSEVFSSDTIKMYSNPVSAENLKGIGVTDLPAGNINWAKLRATELTDGQKTLSAGTNIRTGYNRSVPSGNYGYDFSKGELLKGTLIGDLTGIDTTEKTGRNSAFDNDPATSFAPFIGNAYYYCGIDAGTPHILSKVRVLQQAGNPHRFKGAIIQGSNDQKTWYNLYISDHEAKEGVWEEITVFDVNLGFRYFRYINRTERGDVAELEFYGLEGQISESPENYEYTVPLDHVKVFYDANEGTVKTDYSVMIHGGIYSGLPVPQRKGFSFAGWYTDPTDGIRIEESSKVYAIGDITLYAHWDEEEKKDDSGKLKMIAIVGILAVGLFIGGVIMGKKRSARY